MIKKCLGRDENYDLRMDTVMVGGLDVVLSGCGFVFDVVDKSCCSIFGSVNLYNTFCSFVASSCI